MASYSEPRITTKKAGAAISKGMAVKAGADKDHVVKCSAATDKILGIAQNDASSAEDPVEVALPGGGGLGKAGGAISAGDLLTSDGSGELIATTTNDDRHIGMAVEDAADGDVFPLEVVAGIL